jgi:DNA replication ATP-dependent helicase Dna2
MSELRQNIMRKTILNALETQYYYDQLGHLSTKGDETSKQRLQRLYVAFLSLLNNLTEDREQQIFTGWYAKLHFVCQAYGLGSEWESELQGLRRLLRKNSLQVFFNPSEVQFLTALSLLTRLVQIFATEDAPQLLKEKYENEELISLAFKEDVEQKVSRIFGTVQDKDTEIIYDEKNRGTASFTLFTEEHGIISISVADIHYYSKKNTIFHQHNLSREIPRLMPYQPVSVTNLELVGEKQYVSTDKSLIILNPDYLVDASAIAKCKTFKGQTPYLYLLSKLEFFAGNEGTFRGKVINELLDKLVENPEITFQEAYKDAFIENSIDAAFIDKEKLKEITRQLKEHFFVVQKHISPYFENLLTTEPTFISSKYGLQGRIDLLVEHKESELKDRKDIIELKSAKAPDMNISNGWKNDLIQVACYNLLIDSTFEKRTGISALLYSSDSQNGLRDCGSLDFDKQTAMEIRNKIVAMDMWIANGSVKVFDNLLISVERSNPAFFDMDKAKDFDTKWQTASQLDKAYFVEFIALVMREAMFAKVGGMAGTEPVEGFASLWRNTATEKSDNFSLLNELIYEEWDKKETLLTLKRPENQSITSFRTGDIIVIYPIEEDREDKAHSALHYQILKGNIEEISSEKVVVKIWSKHINQVFFESYPKWGIEPNLMERTFNDLSASLADFLGADNHKKGIIYGQTEPRFDENFKIDYTQETKNGGQNKGLSQEQNEIFNRALSAKDYFLLQGPPGTGKTSAMLKNMVDYLYNETDQIVVLLAFTNRATDEICQKVKLVCGDDFVRLGNVKEDSVFYNNSLKASKSLDELKAKIHTSRVFVSTVSSFYSNLRILNRDDPNGGKLTFDTLIVDEASQLLEPHLCGILPKFKRFILIGDEKQLPAVVTQPSKLSKAKSPLLHEIGIEDLSQSVFERLVENAEKRNWTNCVAMLSTQYRTHQDIAEFISTEFYKTLKAGSERQFEKMTYYNADSEDELEKFLSKGRVLFIPTKSEKGTKFHSEEADKVVELLRSIHRIFGDDFDEQTVGVITPYRAQIAQIYQRLDENLRKIITVDTVERYQGSERKIIILSMATNHAAQMRFLESLNTKQTVDKKLNVALSRAKEQLILLGNPQVLKTGKFYGKFLEWVERK